VLTVEVELIIHNMLCGIQVERVKIDAVSKPVGVKESASDVTGLAEAEEEERAAAAAAKAVCILPCCAALPDSMLRLQLLRAVDL